MHILLHLKALIEVTSFSQKPQVANKNPVTNYSNSPQIVCQAFPRGPPNNTNYCCRSWLLIRTWWWDLIAEVTLVTGYKQIKFVPIRKLPAGCLNTRRCCSCCWMRINTNYFAHLWLTAMPSLARYARGCISYIAQEEDNGLKPRCPVRKNSPPRMRLPSVVTHNWVTECIVPDFAPSFLQSYSVAVGKAENKNEN